MPQLFRSTTRWAVYLRDGLSCTYCGAKMVDLLSERNGNFLTLDHVKLKSSGGGHDPTNLVTSCYHCNVFRGTKTITAFAKDLRIHPQSLRDRIRVRTSKDIEAYRPAAHLALGLMPGFPVAQMVVDHDFLVRAQWQASNLDVAHYEHLRAEESLFCPHCNRPRDYGAHTPPEHEPYDDLDGDIPF